MRDFTGQRANLLLCTTIIETGIDNPHANTILINRSEKFGLAQLHQLRGRVGRSHHQAYAYLLVQDEKAMTKQAKQRLEAIQMMEELGSGFFLAMHDLEIRGAGEVLGDNQSGEMQEVGFNMYTDMLNRAVAALKQGKHLAATDLTQPLGVGTEINLRTPALLPDAYCPDVHERLTLYKRLANCDSTEEIDGLQEELIDRFGELPLQAQSLLATHRLRLLVKPLMIQKLANIFAAIEASANGYPSERDIKGLFADFDTTSNRLGNTVKDKNDRLSKVLKRVAERWQWRTRRVATAHRIVRVGAWSAASARASRPDSACR